MSHRRLFGSLLQAGHYDVTTRAALIEHLPCTFLRVTYLIFAVTTLVLQTRELGHRLNNLSDVTQLVSGGIDLDRGGPKPEPPFNRLASWKKKKASGLEQGSPSVHWLWDSG